MLEVEADGAGRDAPRLSGREKRCTISLWIGIHSAAPKMSCVSHSATQPTRCGGGTSAVSISDAPSHSTANRKQPTVFTASVPYGNPPTSRLSNTTIRP